MPKLIRFATSFVAVLGAYWLYALVAVPLIEPAAASPQGSSAGDLRRGAARRISDRLGDLQQLVPPQAQAQLQTPWIIESGDVKLLMQKYTNRDDGRVKIEPCVLIYTPGSSKENAEPKPPIVLYAPAGAMMVFSRPLDLRKGDVERPTSGRLLGEITITSPGQSDGPEDDLLIVTRDVQLTPDRVSTTNPVRFRYGASYGSGRNLVIKFQQEEQRPGSTGEPPDIEGIESFELLELDHLHLVPPKKDEPIAAEVDKEADELGATGPVEITCRGPFRFDPIQQYARFEDQVDVMRLNPEGPADQLNCELLTLRFSRSRQGLVKLDGKQEESGPLGMDGTDLQLREIEATGNPVIVRVFSRDAEARGEQLVYDVEQKRVTLELGDEVFLREGKNEIHGRSIQYTLKGKGRLGEAFAQGPGWMQGEMGNDPGQEFHAKWGDRLQLEPFEDQHLATLSGGGELTLSDMGTLNAERIDFWLFERPEGPGQEKLEIVPDRMTIQGQVKIDSPEVFGNFNQMEIWFEEAAESSPVASVAGPAVAGPAVAGPAVAGPPSTTSASSGGTLESMFKRRSSDEPIEERFHVRGDLAQAQILIRSEEADETKTLEVTKMLLKGNVQIDEIPLVPRSEPPTHVEGDLIEVSDYHDTAKTQISVLGRPALLRGRGMAVRGTNIKVNNATNILRIDGDGDMRLPMDRDLNGKPLSQPDVVTLSWQKKMEFDGRKATFEERVLVQGTDQYLRTEVLEAYFSPKIEFRDVQSKERPKPDVEQIVCRGGVFMEGRSDKNALSQSATGGAGLLHQVSTPTGVGPRPATEPSWGQFQAAELTVNRRTGVFSARGPGHITAIWTKPKDAFKTLPGKGRPAAGPASDDKGLSYLHVRFPQMMRGNIDQQVATFDARVDCVYDEVDSWQARRDPDDPDSLSDKGMLLTADRLTVARTPLPVADDRSIELEALGNVIAENATFTARANRMTYSEAKDWLILEGNGYSPAELTFQQYIGAAPKTIPASKIHFRPKTKEVNVDDVRSFQMDSLPLP